LHISTLTWEDGACRRSHLHRAASAPVLRQRTSRSARRLGRRTEGAPEGTTALVNPDMILRWHRDIIRHRWATPSMHGNTGRAATPPEHQGLGSPAGPREPRMGLPEDPRRAGRPRSEGSGVDDVGDSEGDWNRPRAAADRSHLIAVHAFSGRGDPGVRLLHGLCVPKTSSTSCDQAVFVDQVTNTSLFSDAVLVEVDRFG
jgi:hypothetical protein